MALVSRASSKLSQASEQILKPNSSCITPTTLSNRELPDLTGKIAIPSCMYLPAFGGGNGDIWVGAFDESQGHKFTVAIRVLRARDDNFNPLEKLQREIYGWKDLSHSNIVPLWGTVTELGPHQLTGLVSPWMANGNLTHYLQKAQPTLTTRFQLLCDVADALKYLHDQGLTHGDLTGTNVLIDHDGKACLIGCAFTVADSELEETTKAGAAMRWRAPELLPPIDADLYTFIPIINTASDIYSFGSLTLQILSNRVPYHYITSNDGILLTVARGDRPRRPEDETFRDAYWRFICWCWGEFREPDSRPSVNQVQNALQALTMSNISLEG